MCRIHCHLPHFTRFFASVLLIGFGSILHPVNAMPPPTMGFHGTVINAQDGNPVRGATVRLYPKGYRSEVTSDANGQFAVATSVTSSRPLVVTAIAPGMIGLPFVVEYNRRGPFEQETNIYLLPERKYRIRVVDTAGNPISRAKFQVDWYKPPYFQHNIDGDALIPSPGHSSVTNTEGWATLHGLPAHGQAIVSLSHPNFATGYHPVELAGTEEQTFKLFPSTTITGRILLGENQPVFLSPSCIETDIWTYPGTTVIGRGKVEVNSDGHYKITDLPPLDTVGLSELRVQVVQSWSMSDPRRSDIARSWRLPQYGDPAPGGHHVAPWQRKNALLQQGNRGKRLEMGVFYHVSAGAGLKYTPGEQIQHDIRFEPMALLRGKLPPQENHPRGLAAVAYLDPRCPDIPGKTLANENGYFELPVPTGDVTLLLPKRKIILHNVKANEICELD